MYKKLLECVRESTLAELSTLLASYSQEDLEIALLFSDNQGKNALMLAVGISYPKTQLIAQYIDKLDSALKDAILLHVNLKGENALIKACQHYDNWGDPQLRKTVEIVVSLSESLAPEFKSRMCLQTIQTDNMQLNNMNAFMLAARRNHLALPHLQKLYQTLDIETKKALWQQVNHQEMHLLFLAYMHEHDDNYSNKGGMTLLLKMLFKIDDVEFQNTILQHQMFTQLSMISALSRSKEIRKIIPFIIKFIQQLSFDKQKIMLESMQWSFNHVNILTLIAKHRTDLLENFSIWICGTHGINQLEKIILKKNKQGRNMIRMLCDVLSELPELLKIATVVLDLTSVIEIWQLVKQQFSLYKQKEHVVLQYLKVLETLGVSPIIYLEEATQEGSNFVTAATKSGAPKVAAECLAFFSNANVLLLEVQSDTLAKPSASCQSIF